MRKVLRPKFIFPGICLALVLLAISTTVARHPTVHIFDKEVHVLCVGVSRGTNHVLFEGNSLEGRLRERLSSVQLLSRIGLRVQPMPSHHFRTARDACVFLVKYTADVSELSDVDAELVGARGASIQLKPLNLSVDTRKREYVKTWVLDPVPADSRRLTRKLLLHIGETRLAEIEIGSL